MPQGLPLGNRSRRNRHILVMSLEPTDLSDFRCCRSLWFILDSIYDYYASLVERLLKYDLLRANQITNPNILGSVRLIGLTFEFLLDWMQLNKVHAAFAAMLLWTLMLLPTQTMSDVRFPIPDFETPDFVDEVERISRSGNILFANEGSFRLWGLVPFEGYVQYLEEILVGKELICVHAGSTFGRLGRGSVWVRAADCTLQSDSLSHPSFLTKRLIDLGYAGEFCVETQNAFKNCD